MPALFCYPEMGESEENMKKVTIKNKEHREYDNKEELYNHFSYWCTATGDFFHNGNYCEEKDVPEPLLKAYNELYKEGNGCHEYLAEYNGKYYIALVSEFDSEYAEDSDMSMDELFEIGKDNALNLYSSELFANTMLVIGKGTGVDGCHEFMFLVPVETKETVYDEIEKNIYEKIYQIGIEDLITNDYATDELNPTRTLKFTVNRKELAKYLIDNNDERTISMFLETYDSDESAYIHEKAENIISEEITYCDDFNERYDDFVNNPEMDSDESFSKEDFYWNVYRE